MTNKNELTARRLQTLTLSKKVTVSIIIVTYNSKDVIGENLQSLLAQSFQDFEIIVVDNTSSDGTPEYVEKNYAAVRVLRSRSNLGYCGGNALGARFAKGNYIVVLNPDVVLDRYWLEELLSASARFPQAAILGSNILFYEKPSRVNTYGVRVHYTGLAFTRGSGSSQVDCREEKVLAPAGTAFLVLKSVIADIPFFDPDYFMELGEVDFAIRALLAGGEVRIIPSSKVYHKYVYKMNPRRLYGLERSRYKLLINNFSKRTLAILVPSLLLTELVTFSFSFYAGKQFMRSKIDAVIYSIKYFRQKRKKATVYYKKNDKEILKLMDWIIEVPESTISNLGIKLPVKKILDAAYSKLYHLALSML